MYSETRSVYLHGKYLDAKNNPLPWREVGQAGLNTRFQRLQTHFKRPNAARINYREPTEVDERTVLVP
jgi:hypothetical protein